MDPQDESNNAAKAAGPHGAEDQSPDLPLTDSVLGGLLRAGSSQPRLELWQPPSPEELQHHFPQYEIRGILGRGGMGAVYKGWQKSLHRFVAIKILPSGIQDDGMEFTGRFKQEARAMAKFRHPGIVAVYDAGETHEGLLYFIMECIEGKDVAQVVAERGKLPPAEALRIASRVCEAVAYAHEHGVIHRDIKPSNVMIEADGTVKVADFGLAKFSTAESAVNTMSSVQIGSLDFMPPEGLSGSANVDHRGDIYGIGGMLYQMLTGKSPHGRFEPPSVAVPGLDKRFDAIVEKAMHADAAKRHSSAAELLAEFMCIAATEPQPATGNAAARSRRAFPKPLLAMLLVTAIVCIAVASLGPWKKSGTGTPADDKTKAGPDETKANRRNWKPAPSLFNATIDRDATHLQHFETWSAGASQKTNVAVRSIIAWQPNPPGRNELIKVTARWTDTEHYYACLYNSSVEVGYYRAPNLVPLQRWPIDPPPAADEAVSLQLACVGQRLAVWVRGSLVGVFDDDTLTGPGKVGVQAVDGHFRSLDHLDLDGLADAEVFRLLGLDASGSSAVATGTPGSQIPDKAAAITARWHDAFSESPLKEVIAAAERTAQGYRLPENNHWAISPQPLRSGALRVRATAAGEKFVSLYIAHEDRQFERIRFLGRNSEWVLSAGVLATQEADLAAKRASFPLDGMPHDLLLARLGGRLRVSVDGHPLLDEADSNATAGRFVLDIFPEAKISVEKVEYLDLDGVPEAEALKLFGPAASGIASPTPAAATKDTPFVNSLGMKFVPVPITGGPTDGQRVLFSIWETRVRDYEACAIATKRAWAKPPFEQAPTHPAVSVSWEEAQAFCAWLTENERKSGRIGATQGYRLPSDHEWSCAVGIGHREDPAKAPFTKSQAIADVYPWGTIWPPPRDAGNYSGEEVLGREMNKDQKIVAGYRDAFLQTSPVGSFPANRFGLFDLGGNAWEFCEDPWKDGDSLRVMRGASFAAASRSGLLSCFRDSLAPDVRASSIGFRVVLSATPSRQATREREAR